MRYKEVVRSFLKSQSNKEKNTNPHSQLHILTQPEVIPNNSGRKENWYIRFITLCMSNFNIPGKKSFFTIISSIFNIFIYCFILSIVYHIIISNQLIFILDYY